MPDSSRRCSCPKHLQWSPNVRQFRVSARTRSWENAERLARAKEKETGSATNGGKPIIGPMTVADAVAKYLADKPQQGLFDDTTSKLENIGEAIPRLVYVGQRPYLRDLDLERLREWRGTWKGGALTRKKLQERVQGLFWFCLRSGWIGSHPAKGLSKIQVEDPPTDYFPKEEFAKIVDSTYLDD
jgi:integrase/recombinase XerD